MTLLTRTTPWAFRWLRPPPRICISVRSVFGITCVRSLGIFYSALSTCLLGARIDLSDEDYVIALVLAECPTRPYTEPIKSDIPGPSSSRSARSAALRPSPPSSMRVSPIGPSAAKPTKGELLVQLETLSQKPQSVKRKTLGSTEKDRPASAKVPKLGGVFLFFVYPCPKAEASIVASGRGSQSLEFTTPFWVCCEGEKSLG